MLESLSLNVTFNLMTSLWFLDWIYLNLKKNDIIHTYDSGYYQHNLSTLVVYIFIQTTSQPLFSVVIQSKVMMSLVIIWQCSYLSPSDAPIIQSKVMKRLRHNTSVHDFTWNYLLHQQPVIQSIYSSSVSELHQRHYFSILWRYATDFPKHSLL